MCSTLNAQRTPACIVLVIFAMASAGCGPGNGLERAVVSGEVTLNSNPLPQGTIRLIPTGGTTGPVSVGQILDGKYVIDAKGGVPVGEHQVSIEALRPIPGRKEIEIPELGTTHRATEQYIPEGYNRKTTLRMTVAPGDGTLTQHFHLD